MIIQASDGTNPCLSTMKAGNPFAAVMKLMEHFIGAAHVCGVLMKKNAEECRGGGTLKWFCGKRVHRGDE